MIFNIQRYSAHSSLGIRTVVFLKDYPLDCHWCRNPESRTRTQDLLYDSRLCLEGCELCAKTAPEVIEPALNGLLIHREELTPEHFTVLIGCCPTQTLTVCDEVKSVKEIMAAVLRGKPSYGRSGGGLTFSSKESFMQPETAMGLLQASHEAGIHTAVKTCLRVPWKHITLSLSYIDLFLANLKHVAGALLKQWTSSNAARVLDNLKELAAAGKKIIIHMPLIRGFNTDETSVKAIAGFATDELRASEIHFLPYHTLGTSKYHLLNLPYGAPEKPLDTPELLNFTQQYAHQKGLTATS